MSAARPSAQSFTYSKTVYIKQTSTQGDSCVRSKDYAPDETIDPRTHVTAETGKRSVLAIISKRSMTEPVAGSATAPGYSHRR